MAITYLFYDLLTNVKIAELPLSGVKFGAVLNGVGGLTGSLNLRSSQVQAELAALGGTFGSALNTAKTAIYVDIDGVIEWGGILWTTNYNSRTGIINLGASEFWSYFAQSRRIDWNFSVANYEQLTAVKQIIDHLQAETNGNIGVITPSVVSGQQVTISFDASQYIGVAQAVSQIAQQSGVKGFDFAIDVAYVAGVPTKTLTLSYPRRGRIAGSTGLVFDIGNKWGMGYVWPEDGTAACNVVYGIGAGTGPTTAANGGGLRSIQGFPTAFSAGYPLLEGSMQRSDITSQATLDALTIGYLGAHAYPVILPKMTFALDMPDPQFGSYIMGDDAQLVIPPDEYFPTGLNEYQRIVAWEVTVADEGTSYIDLSFTSPPLEL